MHVTVVGAGLAGSEAAFQLAERGVSVRLIEMKGTKRTPAQSSDSFCELVCSNSMRGAALGNAVGLLKEELRRAGSLILRMADRTQVPAGGALAVDRELFAAEVTAALRAHPNITIEEREVTEVPTERPVILATGPLTSDALAADLERLLGSSRLAYYDAIAPIVAADSIDWSKVWKQSRYGKGVLTGDAGRAAASLAAADAAASTLDERALALASDAAGAAASGEGDAEQADDGGDEAYVNCPFDEAGYKAFVEALKTAEQVEARSFEQVRYFEGCLPCEVMAERGEKTLSFGPMKPMGLTDPRTGRRPFAVVQLRPEDQAATAYNLVGFQTRMKYAEQLRVFRMIPGLEEAEFLRMGSIHRNTFLDAPSLLDETMQLKSAPGVYAAGQLSGVEGYVESAAGGFLCAVMLARTLAGQPLVLPAPTTALGGILTHLSRPSASGSYQPSNITWAHFPPLVHEGKRLKKRARYEKLAERALADHVAFVAALGVPSPA